MTEGDLVGSTWAECHGVKTNLGAILHDFNTLVVESRRSFVKQVRTSEAPSLGSQPDVGHVHATRALQCWLSLHLTGAATPDRPFEKFWNSLPYRSVFGAELADPHFSMSVW